jgi:hypothetical protein
VFKFSSEGTDHYSFAESLPRSSDQIVFAEQGGTDSSGWKYFEITSKLDNNGFNYSTGYIAPSGISRTNSYFLERSGEGWIYNQITTGNDSRGKFEYFRKFKVKKID